MSETSLFERLGGYEGIVAIASEFMSRIKADPLIGRFYRHRAEDGVAREQQLLVDFLCANSGGPMYYRGRDMASAHKGMGITSEDWAALLGHCEGTIAAVGASSRECDEVVGFIASFKDVIVEA